MDLEPVIIVFMLSPVLIGGIGDDNTSYPLARGILSGINQREFYISQLQIMPLVRTYMVGLVRLELTIYPL